MKKSRVLFLAFLIEAVAVCGCKDDGVDSQKGGETACSADSFVQTCTGVISYQVCEQNVLATKSCPDGTVCKDGICSPVAPDEKVCNDDDYVSECRDNGYTLCQDGRLLTVPCTNGEVCKSGKCERVTTPGGDTPVPGKPPVMPETCSDDLMIPYCYDNIRLSCQNGKVVQTDCSDFGLACHYGECKAPFGLPCTPGKDKNRCIGNVYISCDYESFKLESSPCGDDICTTVDGVAGCYTPCKASEVSSEYTDFCWGIDGYVTARCVESDDHRYVISDLQKPQDAYGYTQSCPDNEFCSAGECAPRHAGFDAGCTAETKEFCERNIAYSCKKDWFDDYEMNARTCGNATCVVYQDKAFCTSACSRSLEGVKRTYCHYDDYDVSLASVSEECLKIDDGYYWIATEKKSCSECNEYTGMCVDHTPICDDNMNCLDPNREVCDADKDSVRYRCEQNQGQRSGGSYSYYYDSVTESCLDGYWQKTDSETCLLNGCDVKTGKCIEPETNINGKCSDSTDYCAYDGYVVRCEYGSGDALLKSCGDGLCAQTAADSFNCVVACSSEEVGRIVYSECSSSNESVYFECVKNTFGVGPEYYLSGHEESCSNGCRDGGCRGKVHPDDDRLCTEDYRKNCLNDVFAYFSWDRVRTYDCSAENQICVNIGEDFGCYEPCTEADYRKQNLFCVHSDDYDEIYSHGRQCLKADDGRYFWTPEVDELCLHGCDEGTGKCNTIHELEGQSCDVETDSGCDGKYKLVCNWGSRVYSAIDCEEELGVGATCAMMKDGGDSVEPVCILPCNNVGDTKPACKNENIEIQYSCVDTGGVKHWEDDDTVYESCKRGCDVETGKCVKLNEHEGQTCDSDSDPEYCDGSKYIYCHWSEYDVGDCSEDVAGTQCALDNGKAECLYPCDKNELGSQMKLCGTGWASSRLYNAVCTEFENGYFWKNGDDYISCDHGCDAAAKACAKIVSDEYELCDINTFKTSCHDNYLVHCDESTNRVKAQECDSDERCFGSETVKVDCYDTCESKDVGKSSAYCGYGSKLTITSCTKVGTQYLQIPHESFCYHGCNDSKDACAASPYTVGDSCESLSRAKCADDTHYYRCDGDVIALAECESGTVCVNDLWSDAQCEVPECHEGQVKYSCYGAASHTSMTCSRSSYGGYSYSGTYTSSCLAGCDEATGWCK